MYSNQIDLFILPTIAYVYFQIVLVGKVGKNNLGDISVDDISLTPGSCPSKTTIKFFMF